MFACQCKFYDNLRGDLYDRVTKKQNHNFMDYSDDEKLCYLLSCSQRYFAEFLEKACFKRKGQIYRQN